ncbi:MAG TPA: UPF0158 family protein [Gemmataceae bacterium]|jgi:hypothetical protein
MSNSSKTPQTIDELVTFITSVVIERFSSTGQPTDGAVLAERIRHRFPDFSYGQLGLLKLSDAVDYAERKGLLIRNRSVKHLEIRPRDGERHTPTEAGVALRIPHIRPDIWRAFVFIAPGQTNYFDQHTGTVIERQASGQEPDQAQHVLIPTIHLAEQQQWMEEFLQRRPHLDSSEAPVQDPYCFAKFPVWLREHGTGLEREWKQFRVQRVIERIRTWAEKNGIDPSGFFSAPLSSQQLDRVITTSVSYERAIRAAVIAAARNLSIEQLQEISIPIRYVLQALKGV